MTGEQPGGEYHVYLLRCWRESAPEEGRAGWRFSLETVTGQYGRRGFASLEQLFAFLEAEIAPAAKGHDREE